MISIKSDYEISLMKKAGSIVYKIHQYLKPFLKPGITTKEIDKLAYDFIIKEGATPSFLNYDGFPGTICISINDEVVHGIPGERIIKDGDIVKLDIGVCWKGYHGDSAWSYAVGNVSDDIKYLMEHTEKALYKGLEQVKPGNHIGDIGAAIEEYATAHKLGIVRELVGHGIGSDVHEKPDVPNYGKKGTGPVLKKGMCIAIEPMLNLGTKEIYILDDDWTIITRDGLPSAHFEHTLVVTEDGYEITTGDDNFE